MRRTSAPMTASAKPKDAIGTLSARKKPRAEMMNPMRRKSTPTRVFLSNVPTLTSTRLKFFR